MIEFLSSWAKSLGLAIVIVSVLEMLLPNNKTKKYIRMVMGIYILFTIVSPFIKNKEIFDLNEINLENYTKTQITSAEVNQESMDKRIEELYIQELEKDITKKVNEQGFNVIKCNVQAKISDNEEDSKITKIQLNVEKSETDNEENTEKIENKIIEEIQKVKPINTEINIDKNTKEDKESSEENGKKAENTKEKKITKTDIQNIKKFLIEEYEVNEKCLEIN